MEQKVLEKAEIDKLDIDNLQAKEAKLQVALVDERIKSLKLQLELTAAEIKLRESEKATLVSKFQSLVQKSKEFKKLLVDKYEIKSKWGYDPISGNIHEN